MKEYKIIYDSGNSAIIVDTDGNKICELIDGDGDWGESYNVKIQYVCDALNAYSKIKPIKH